MSQGRPRPAQRKAAPLSERLSGGEPWDHQTKPDEDYRLLAKKPGFQRDDYVDFPARAVREEQEAPSISAVQDMAQASSDRFAVMRARENRAREGNSLAGQIRELVAVANKQDADLPELDQIRGLLEKGRLRLRSAA